MKKVLMLVAIVVAASAIVALVVEKDGRGADDADDGTILDYLGV